MIRPVSDARQRRDRDYPDARRAALRRAGGQCEVMALGCSYTADQIHHRAGRTGPDPHRLDNLLACCMECHSRIHLNPEWSRERGFMLSRMGEVRPSRFAQEDAS